MFKPVGRVKIGVMVLVSASSHGKDYKSSELITYEEFRYGAFEARIRAATGSGQILAFFLWKNDSELQDTKWQEQDFEIFGKDGRYQTQIMTPGADGKARTENNLYHSLVNDPRDFYYTYRMEWTPEYLAFYVDGHQVRRETDPIRFSKHLDPMLAEPAQIRISLWAGDSSWAGFLDKSKVPAVAYVDFISVYEYTPVVGDGGSDFSLRWKDDFDFIDTDRWWLANWTFESSVTDYIPQNVTSIDGKAVFLMTDANGVGNFPPSAPKNNPPPSFFKWKFHEFKTFVGEKSRKAFRYVRRRFEN